MASYILRGIDPQLWKQIKMLALKQDMSVKLLVEQLLREAVRRQSSLANAPEANNG